MVRAGIRAKEGRFEGESSPDVPRSNLNPGVDTEFILDGFGNESKFEI